jgi:hypothetical protein
MTAQATTTLTQTAMRRKVEALLAALGCRLRQMESGAEFGQADVGRIAVVSNVQLFIGVARTAA